MLGVNTDCAVCTFPYNKLPFEVDENNVVQGYYYDLEETAPKYRMAEEPTRNEIGRLAKYTRDNFDTLKKPKWKVHQEFEDNDMGVGRKHGPRHRGVWTICCRCLCVPVCLFLSVLALVATEWRLRWRQ